MRNSLTRPSGGPDESAAGQNPVSMPRPACRVMAVASGKGGVGKTVVTANLAVSLARLGRRVLLFDADVSLASADLLLGVIPRYTLEHVLSGEKTLNEIAVETYGGVLLIPAASGVEELANLDDFRRECLFRSLSCFDREIDLILVDTGAGIGRNVTSLLHTADPVLVVSTPEPTAMSGAYALIKLLAGRAPASRPKVLVNMAAGALEAAQVYGRIRSVAEQFLHLTPEDWGFIPRDDAVSRAVMNQEPFVLSGLKSPAVRGIDRLAQRVLEVDPGPIGDTRPGLENLKQARAG